MINRSLASFAGFMLDQERTPQGGSPYGTAWLLIHHVLRTINRSAEETGSPYFLSLEEVALKDGLTVVKNLILFDRHSHKTRTLPMSVTAQLVRINKRACFIGVNSRPSSLLYELVAEIEETLAREGAES